MKKRKQKEEKKEKELHEINILVHQNYLLPVKVTETGAYQRRACQENLRPCSDKDIQDLPQNPHSREENAIM